MEDLYLNLKKEGNIILDKVLENINEQERNKQKLALTIQKIENEREENYLILRKEKKKEKQRLIEQSYKKNCELRNNILSKENEHKTRIKRNEK